MRAIWCGVILLSGCLVPDSCLPIPPPHKHKPSEQATAIKTSPLPKGAIMRLGEHPPGAQRPSEAEVKKHHSAVIAVAQSPRVGAAATGAEDGTVGIWNINTGALISWIDALSGPVHAIDFAPNSRVIVTGSSSGKSTAKHRRTVHIWEVTQGRLIRELVHHDPVYAVAHSPNGGVFVTGGQGGGAPGAKRPSAIRTWDVTTGELLRESYGHLADILSLSFSVDGQLLASGSRDGVIRIWDALSGKPLRELKGQQGEIRSVAFSPKGNLLGSCNGQSLWIWNLASGATWVKQRLERGGFSQLAFFPGGKYLATGGDTLRVWSAATGKVVKTLDGHRGWINALAISTDGRLLLTGGSDQTALVWKFQLGY